MSIREAANVNCPSCHQDFEVSIWQSLNANLDPKGKEDLLAGRLFQFTCPHCHADGTVNYPILYHDMDHHAMVQYIVDEKDVEKAYEDFFEGPDIINDYMKTKRYQIRFVTSQEDLREKAAIFDADLDDRIIELAKIVYAILHQERYPDQNFKEIFFINHNEKGPSLYFATGNPEEDFAIPIADELYNDLKSALSLVPEKDLDKPIIDAKWAGELLSHYNLLQPRA